MPSRPRARDQRLRVILYARVSKDASKEERSVTQQLDIGRTIAAEEDWLIVGEYADNDRSASRRATQEREDWPKVVAAIERGEADVLWVWEISRGTRDLDVWLPLRRVCRENRMFVAIHDDVWDTTKPSHMHHLNQLVLDAEYESEKVHTRTSRGIEANTAKGGAHGPGGYGFRHLHDVNTGRFTRRVVHEPEAEVIREAAQRYLSGETLGSICVDLNDRKVPTSTGLVAGEPVLDDDGSPVLNPVTGEHALQTGWRYPLLVQILQRAALIGKRESKGRLIDAGGWDPIFDGRQVKDVVLDEAAWWTIRDRLLARPRDREERLVERDGAAKHLLSGIALCGVCGARMYRTGDKSAPDGWVYQCRGLYEGAPKGHVSRSGGRMEKAVLTLLVAKFSRPDALDAFRDRGAAPEEVREANARRSELSAELDQLERDVMAGEVSPRMATARERQIEEELARLAEVTRPRLVEPLAEALAGGSPAEVLETWEGWTLEQQRSALRAVTVRIEVPKMGRGRRNVPPQEYVHITWVGDEE
ncbi:recombinase family protein [Nocardiopsis dassonvillei]|uniref:recombinase family protein n=1 Tax=Nocardiopsis dassonvillei TaxID=2014 RepID=UPI0020A462A0|nr:recombinase family protein [Nocardiopsis dassonvillei]MCP3012471.1 recombinase family protein [Nocardiopsis dassonvillei]